MQSNKTTKPQLKPIRRPGQWIAPLVVIMAMMTVIVLDQTGVIQLPHFGHAGVQEITPPAKIGVPCSYDFFDALTPLLGPEGNADPAIYTFYLGSGTGFPPMGLTLGIDGILKGTPTGKGGNFEVCVKDVGGHSACRTYHLTVNPKDSEPDNDNNDNPGGCVIDPHCGEMSGTARIQGVFVISSCNCPAGTKFETDLGETKYCACI